MEQLLTGAGRIMSEMLVDCTTTVSAFMAVQLDRMANAAEAGSPGEKLVASLERSTSVSRASTSSSICTSSLLVSYLTLTLTLTLTLVSYP